jgi:CHAD domain-containing protein
MSFALRQDESIPKGVRRAVGKQLKNAAANLNPGRDSIDERIHSVRKSLKRVRSVVRLVRFSIGEPAYRHENEAFRDAARPLSEVRDAKVLIEAVDKLEKLSRRENKEALFRPVRKMLQKRQRDVRDKLLEKKNTLSDAAEAVEKGIGRLKDWTDFPANEKHISKGIKQVYRSGRKALEEVKAEPSVETLHEWRKQTKYLRHQLELLAPGWPKVVSELITQAVEIGDLLGEDHDLAVLCSILKHDSNLSTASDEVFEMIEHRRSKLQADAVPKGESLFRERPADFVGRLMAYWKGKEKWPKRQRKLMKRSEAAV